jgi:hypothetical protein
MNPQEIVTVSNAEGRLHVRFVDTVRIEDLHRLFEDIRQQAVASKATDLLIDASAYLRPLTMIQRLQMVLAFVARLHSFRVAGVVSETTLDPQRIGETMALNRGANVKVFTRLPEAVAWLDEVSAKRSQALAG